MWVLTVILLFNYLSNDNSELGFFCLVLQRCTTKSHDNKYLRVVWIAGNFVGLITFYICHFWLMDLKWVRGKTIYFSGGSCQCIVWRSFLRTFSSQNNCLRRSNFIPLILWSLWPIFLHLYAWFSSELSPAIYIKICSNKK